MRNSTVHPIGHDFIHTNNKQKSESVVDKETIGASASDPVVKPDTGYIVALRYVLIRVNSILIKYDELVLLIFY